MDIKILIDRIPKRYIVEQLGPDTQSPALQVNEIHNDSRLVHAGDLFVAVRGVDIDGHRFIPDAVQGGAVAVVGEKELDTLPLPHPAVYIKVTNSREVLGWLHAAIREFPANNMTLVGITGTDGKTTTTNLLYSILHYAGVNVGMVSTVNARIGNETFDTGLHTTTPDAPQIQALLAQMRAAGVTHAILEVTSHGLAQGRVAGCEFDVAVITNITHEHLDYHGSWQAYADAKALLFRNVAERGTKNQQIKASLLNLDDAPSYRALTQIPPLHPLAYGINHPLADVHASDVHFAPAGLRFILSYRDESIEIASPLVGMYNVSNILAASGAALALGLPLEAIAAGVAKMEGVPGRMERIDEGQSFLALVDFAHTPNALKRTIEAAKAMIGEEGRVIVVFGSAGLRDLEKRRMMGEIAGQFADKIVITAEDPRTESLDAIMRDIADGVESFQRVEGQDYWCIADRGAAIRFAVNMAHPADIVITCGKGHEQSMCFGTIEYPWDDRDALRKALCGDVLATLPTSAKDS